MTAEASLTDALREILAGSPDRAWTAPEIHAELKARPEVLAQLEARGTANPIPTITMLLNRLVQRGVAHKVGWGHFQWGPEDEGWAEIERLERELEELRELLDHVLNEAMERWHSSGVGPEQAHKWIGLTREQYAAWVEQRPPIVAP